MLEAAGPNLSIREGMATELIMGTNDDVAGRGLHSSTFRLNVSVYCGIGGMDRGCVYGMLRGFLGGVGRHRGLSKVYFVSETVQVELKSGRVYAPGSGRAHLLRHGVPRAGRGAHHRQGLTLVPISAQLERFCLPYNPT